MGVTGSRRMYVIPLYTTSLDVPMYMLRLILNLPADNKIAAFEIITLPSLFYPQTVDLHGVRIEMSSH